MAKILILGAGSCQVNAILQAKRKGHTVIVTDYLEKAIGKKYADYSENVSTFDSEKNIEVASKYQIDAVLTIGTDQPVLTCAQVAEKVGLPSFISVETAKAVTNKKVMKEKFVKYGIPTVSHRILQENFSARELAGIHFPVVIKPLDSQGQRGVYKLNSIEEVRDRFREVRSYSREEEILLEEYYQSDEITISGWVKEGRAKIITITDRVTMNNFPHIGICSAHNFPSKYLADCFQECQQITQRIVEVFAIHNGPIYFQFLIGENGIKVNEIACRIGGAYEDELLPAITGIDILDMVIAGALGQRIDDSRLDAYDLLDNQMHAVVKMIFTYPGIIGRLPDMEVLRQLPGVVSGGFNYDCGSYIKRIENATQRVGYLILQGQTGYELANTIANTMKQLEIRSTDGKDMLIDFAAIR